MYISCVHVVEALEYESVILPVVSLGKIYQWTTMSSIHVSSFIASAPARHSNARKDN